MPKRGVPPRRLMPTENVPRPPKKIPLALLYVSPSISLSLYLSLYLSISLSVYLSIYLSIFIGPVRVFLPLGSSDTIRCFRKLELWGSTAGSPSCVLVVARCPRAATGVESRVRARARVRSGAAPRASRPTLGSSRASGWQRCRCSWQLHGKLKGRFWSL